MQSSSSPVVSTALTFHPQIYAHARLLSELTEALREIKTLLLHHDPQLFFNLFQLIESEPADTLAEKIQLPDPGDILYREAHLELNSKGSWVLSDSEFKMDREMLNGKKEALCGVIKKIVTSHPDFFKAYLARQKKLYDAQAEEKHPVANGQVAKNAMLISSPELEKELSAMPLFLCDSPSVAMTKLKNILAEHKLLSDQQWGQIVLALFYGSDLIDKKHPELLGVEIQRKLMAIAFHCQSMHAKMHNKVVLISKNVQQKGGTFTCLFKPVPIGVKTPPIVGIQRPSAPLPKKVTITVDLTLEEYEIIKNHRASKQNQPKVTRH